MIVLLGGGMLLARGPGDETDLGILFAILLVGLISGLLVAKRPDHRISWLLTGAALAGGIAGLSAQALPSGLTELSWWQATLAIISGPAWYALLLIVLVLIPLLFPTGAPPSSRWRWVGWIGGGSTAVFSALWALQERFCTDSGESGNCLSQADNPIGITGLTNPEESVIGGFLYVGLLLGAVAALISLLIRFRRSGAVERQQMKWVGFSIGLFLTETLAVEVLWIDVLGQPESPVFAIIQQILWVAIPTSIAIAILRYRLYEIDRIVSRTVSYALIAVVLASVYAGGVIGLQALIPDVGDLAIAASTLAAVALFSPLRRRIQGWVDRRFNRRRYDAERVVEAFSSRLRDAVDLASVTADLRDVVTRTVEPVVATLWLRDTAPR
ncbi:MAG TPA: hypothetical protein VFT54_04000 [Acidimicrobiia bacterium]|nr:hypothetical protein [Acidimicrobiia bacterium]